MKQEKKSEGREPIPRWKKIAILVAALVVLAGVGLRYGTSPGGAAEDQELFIPAGSHSLVENPGRPPDGSPPAVSTKEKEEGLGRKFSPFLIHGGISFFVGLAIGAAARAFLKIVMVVVGVILLGYFGLTYTGIVSPIDWQAVEKWMIIQIEEADKKTSDFRKHLLTSLPSAGMAGAGLVTGFKRK